MSDDPDSDPPSIREQVREALREDREEAQRAALPTDVRLGAAFTDMIREHDEKQAAEQAAEHARLRDELMGPGGGQ